VYGALLSSLDKDDVFAISLGGRLSYYLGRNRATSLSVVAFYAPEIITFGNADSVSDVSVQFSTRLTATTRVLSGIARFNSRCRETTTARLTAVRAPGNRMALLSPGLIAAAGVYRAAIRVAAARASWVATESLRNPLRSC
jgi:hypothetical protein